MFGQQKTDKDVRKLASRLKTTIGAMNSLRKPALDVLDHAGSKLGVLRSILEAELKIVHAADLSTVPTPTGCPKDFAFRSASAGADVYAFQDIP